MIPYETQITDEDRNRILEQYDAGIRHFKVLKDYLGSDIAAATVMFDHNMDIINIHCDSMSNALYTGYASVVSAVRREDNVEHDQLIDIRDAISRGVEAISVLADTMNNFALFEVEDPLQEAA